MGSSKAVKQLSVKGVSTECSVSAATLSGAAIAEGQAAETSLSTDTCTASPTLVGRRGFQNNGNTCFANSLLQQLAGIPSFSLAIQNMKLKADGEWTALKHLQLMFEQLGDVCGSQAVGTDAFCIAIDKSLNYPYNMNESHDCDEFMHILFEVLQKNLNSTKHKNLLLNQFGGTAIARFYSPTRGKLYNNSDKFYSLCLSTLPGYTLSQPSKVFFGTSRERLHSSRWRERRYLDEDDPYDGTTGTLYQTRAHSLQLGRKQQSKTIRT